MSLFFFGLGRSLSKKGRVAMLIGDMGLHLVEEEKLRDREE